MRYSEHAAARNVDGGKRHDTVQSNRRFAHERTSERIAVDCSRTVITTRQLTHAHRHLATASLKIQMLGQYRTENTVRI